MAASQSACAARSAFALMGVCMEECEYLKVYVHEDDQDLDTSYVSEAAAAKKKRQLSPVRTIKTREELSSDIIFKSFAKALPQNTVVEV